MARLNRDHSSWRADGLYLKYQQPAVSEAGKVKTKKDTRKWCRGKVGKEHELVRYFYYTGWESVRTTWIRSRCANCQKEFHKNDSSIPLKIYLDESDSHISYPVQVKVNGRAIPFTTCQLKALDLEHWTYCEYCKDWH